MCIIIVKDKESTVNNSVIVKSLGYNPDGFGVTFLDNGETFKSMKLLDGLEWIKSERPFIFHARYSTRGVTNLSNAHPIRIGNTENMLYQNGTANVSIKNGLSDTNTIAGIIDEVASKTNRDPMKDQIIEDILQMSDSRFVITDGKDYKLFNKSDWKKKENIYYSKDNVLKDGFVFMYGSCKKGNINDDLMKWYKRLTMADTVQKYTIFKKGVSATIEPDGDYNVRGELYSADTADINSLTKKLDGKFTTIDIEVETSYGVKVTAKTFVSTAETNDGWRRIDSDTFSSYGYYNINKYVSPFDFMCAKNNFKRPNTYLARDLIADAVVSGMNMSTFRKEYEDYCSERKASPSDWIFNGMWIDEWKRIEKSHSKRVQMLLN